MDNDLERVNLLKGHKGDILSCITFENYFITAGYDQKILIWNASTNSVKLQINDAHEHIISCLDLYVHREKHNDSNTENLIPYIISSSWDRTCKVFNFHSGKHISTFNKHNNRIKVVKIVVENDFSNSIVTPKVISGDDNSKIYLWTLFQGEMLYCLEGHSRGILNIITYNISPFETFFASSSLDSSIRIWDLVAGELKHVIHTTSSKINCLAVTSLSQSNAINSASNHAMVSPAHASNKITLPSLSTNTLGTHNTTSLIGTVDSAASIIVSSLEAKESFLEAALPVVIPTLLVTGDQDCHICIYQACGSAIGSMVFKLDTLERITSLFLKDTLELTYFSQYVNKSNNELTSNVNISVTNPYLLYVLENGTIGFVDMNTIASVINLCSEVTLSECERTTTTTKHAQSQSSHIGVLYKPSTRTLRDVQMTHMTTGDVMFDIKECTNQNSMNESAISLHVQRCANSFASSSNINNGSFTNDNISSDTKLNIHKQLLKKSKSKMRRLSSFVKDMNNILPSMEKKSFTSICEEKQLSDVPPSSSQTTVLLTMDNITDNGPYEPVLCCYLSAKIVCRDSQGRVIFKENENGNGEIITYHQYLFLGGKDGMLLSKLYVYSQRATLSEKKAYTKEVERVNKTDKSSTRKTLALARHQSDISPLLQHNLPLSTTEHSSSSPLKEKSSKLRHSVSVIPTHHSSYHQDQLVENSVVVKTTNKEDFFDSSINKIMLYQDGSPDQMNYTQVNDELKHNQSISDDLDLAIVPEEEKHKIIRIIQSQYHSWKESLDIIASTSNVDASNISISTAQKFINTNKGGKNRKPHSDCNIISDPTTGALWPSAVLEQVKSSLKRVKLHSKKYNQYTNNHPQQQQQQLITSNTLNTIVSKPTNNNMIKSSSVILENNNDHLLPKLIMRSRVKHVTPINHRHQVIPNKPNYFLDNTFTIAHL